MRRSCNIARHRLFLLCLFIFAPSYSYSQEPTKEQIKTFGITSITTIDGDGRVKSIEVFNEAGELVKILDLNKGDTVLRKSFLFKGGSDVR